MKFEPKVVAGDLPPLPEDGRTAEGKSRRRAPPWIKVVLDNRGQWVSVAEYDERHPAANYANNIHKYMKSTKGLRLTTTVRKTEEGKYVVFVKAPVLTPENGK